MLFEDHDSVSRMLALPVAVFVQAAYKKLLDRLPDPLELKSNIGALCCGLGRVQFLTNIRQSQEFQARDHQLLNEAGDNEFVAREFAKYLGRTPDARGLEHYLKMLKAGKSRELVRRDIANSKEAKRSYTFWYELDRLINDHKISIHPIKRWFGKRRREDRRRNQEFEILTTSYNSNISSDIQSNYRDQKNQNYNSAIKITPHTHQITLSRIEGRGLNGGARKILSRLQHASGISSSNRNHS